MASLISLDRIEKRYSLEKSPRRRMLELLFSLHQKSSYQALAPLSLEINRGESLGIIGRNGAGKSTLLQMLSGVLAPSSGTVVRRGRVSALLELGAGLSPELTGRENIEFHAPFSGIDPKNVQRKIKTIIDFSELEEFIDQPVRVYSTGMAMRLAFAIATASEPDLLIVDEALSVGDGKFSKKSFGRIMELKDTGRAVIFCSHVLYQIEKLCDRVLWLEKGQVMALGHPSEIIPRYERFLDRDEHETKRSISTTARPDETASPARIKQVKTLKNSQPLAKEEIPKLSSGIDSLEIQVLFEAPSEIGMPHLAFVILDKNRTIIASTSTERDQITRVADSQGLVSCSITFHEIPLLRGEYSVDVLLLCDRGIQFLEQIYDAVRFKVTQNHLERGVVTLPRRWKSAT